MSVSMSRSDGVKVLSLTPDPSDPPSACPPLCQPLWGLCYRSGLCSAPLPSQRGGPLAVLGALWILTALLHLGLGLVLIDTREAEVAMMRDTNSPVWLGLLFLFLGGACVLSERFPRPPVTLLTGLLNLCGAGLALGAIVINSRDLSRPGFDAFCWRIDLNYYPWARPAPPGWSPSPDHDLLRGRCVEARALLKGLTTGLRVLLLTLSFMDLCLGISAAVLSFRALRSGRGEGEESQERKEEEKKSTTEEEKGVGEQEEEPGEQGGEGGVVGLGREKASLLRSTS